MEMAELSIDDLIEERNKLHLEAEAVSEQCAQRRWIELGVANRHIARVLEGHLQLTRGFDALDVRRWRRRGGSVGRSQRQSVAQRSIDGQRKQRKTKALVVSAGLRKSDGAESMRRLSTAGMKLIWRAAPGPWKIGQSAPRHVWNKRLAPVAEAVVERALQQPELSPREPATAFVDQQQYFVSEASLYRAVKGA
jgi:hypothetical protein